MLLNPDFRFARSGCLPGRVAHAGDSCRTNCTLPTDGRGDAGSLRPMVARVRTFIVTGPAILPAGPGLAGSGRGRATGVGRTETARGFCPCGQGAVQGGAADVTGRHVGRGERRSGKTTLFARRGEPDGVALRHATVETVGTG